LPAGSALVVPVSITIVSVPIASAAISVTPAGPVIAGRLAFGPPSFCRLTFTSGVKEGNDDGCDDDHDQEAGAGIEIGEVHSLES
jgi:hypothetical protein